MRNLALEVYVAHSSRAVVGAQLQCRLPVEARGQWGFSKSTILGEQRRSARPHLHLQPLFVGWRLAFEEQTQAYMLFEIPQIFGGPRGTQ